MREGDALERLAKAQIIAFDKTGTLTVGTPEVVAVSSVLSHISNDALFRLAASAEPLSEHPLGKAIVSGCQKTGTVLADAADFRMIPGRGVCAQVEGKTVLAGNLELLSAHGIQAAPVPNADASIRQGCTVTYVAVDGVFAGFLALSDTLRKEGAATIDALSELGIRPCCLPATTKTPPSPSQTSCIFVRYMQTVSRRIN